jgi:hypothetical protein
VEVLDELLRASRVARLTARRERAQSTELRAAMRAQHLISRAVVARSRELKALVQASQAIERARGIDRRSPGAPRELQRRGDMQRGPGVED